MAHLLDYTRIRGNPIYTYNYQSGLGNVHGSVLYFPDGEDGYKYWMALEHVVDGSTAHIYIVRSNDGVIWTETGISNPVIQLITYGEDTYTHLCDPCLLKVGSTWYLYICAEASWMWRFTSSDGKSWALSPEEPIHPEALASPSVMYDDDDSLWKMWYYNGQALNYATSGDGVTWTAYGSNPVFTPSDGHGLWHHTVCKLAGTYYLYWNGYDATGERYINTAYSSDGITWIEYPENPILSYNQQGWDSGKLYTPGIMRTAAGKEPAIVDGVAWLYFGGYSGSYNIGLAFSPAPGYKYAIVEASLDGRVTQTYSGSGRDWSVIRGAAGSNAYHTGTVIAASFSGYNGYSPPWYDLSRIIWLFTLSLSTDDVIIKAFVSARLYTKQNLVPSTSPTWSIYASDPASDDELVAGDYDALGDTPYSNAWEYGALPAAEKYIQFVLNATGLAAVPSSGIAKLGMREDVYDVGGATPTTPTGDQHNSLWPYTYEKGAGYRPALEVIYQQIVGTYRATNISSDAALGNGYLSNADSIDEIGFEWGTVRGTYPNDVVDSSGSYEAGDFSLYMQSLSPDTAYWYRAKVHHTSYGWIYGNDQYFDTTLDVPTTQTDPPSDVTTTTVDAEGDILSTGSDATCDKRGVVYGLSSQDDPGNTAPGASGYDGYAEDSGSFSTGSFTKQVTGLTANRIYYLRVYSHNASAGYHYGDEIIVSTHDTVSILYPSSMQSLGVRFDTSPGGAYPNTPYGGAVTHNVLVLGESSEWFDTGWWGVVSGKYIYERRYSNTDFYLDLYNLTNPFIRSGAVVKIKWKATLWRNSYPYGQYKRALRINSTNYIGSADDIDSPASGACCKCEVFYDNPDSGSAWTVSDLDALIAGLSLGNEGGYGRAICDRFLVFACWANATVTADSATDIGGGQLRLSGTLSEDEAEVCSVYFEWGTTPSYGNTTTPETKIKGETFTADITASAPIHYRAVVETACGETFYSTDHSYSGGKRSQVIIIP